MYFSDEDIKLLKSQNFQIQTHPNTPEFAIQKNSGGESIICLNEDGSFSASHDSDEENVGVFNSIQESLRFLKSFE